MAKSFSTQFPDQYIDNSGNTRLDGSNVSINNSLDVTDSAIDAKKPITFRENQTNEGLVYFNNDSAPDFGNMPAGYVTLGFDENQPYFASADFGGTIKYLDARALRIATEDLALFPSDEFVLFGGTEANPLTISMPDPVYYNGKVHYLGGVGSYYGLLDSGNIEMSLIKRSTGEEIFRGTTLELDFGTKLDFIYTIVSTDPIVTEWTAGVDFL